ncbi:RNA polymerase sigma factor [Paraburkholderia sp. EG287A]|uniref:RNA polymerase sigma factor n=1 Tax=unclassified Paraburkholderia TaxID=2615204 RepID=UPI0034D1DE97
MSSTDLPNMLPAMLPRLWAFALRLTRDRHDAEDLVQRACVRALERVDQLQPETAPLSWMFSIVHTTWINELQARNVRNRSSAEWDESRIQNVPDRSIRTPEEVLMSRQIIGAVMRLPEAQRAVMLLIALEGMSYAETAEILNVPIGTVMSRLARARQTIGEGFMSGR